MPIVMQNWYPDTRAPRTFFGAISDMYRMIMAETNPTPKPAIRRPATRRPRLESGLENDTDDEDEASRNDGSSSTKPIGEITSEKAPKKVPAERMEVMRDFFQSGRVKALLCAVVGFAGRYGKPS
jgi:hypothetical protein